MLDPFQSIAGIFDRARPLLRRAPMVAPLETADQGVGRLQQRDQHADRTGRSFSPRLLNPVAAQILRRQTDELAMLVQPLRQRLQLSADLVIGEEIEWAGLDGAFLTHCRLRRWRFLFWNQWLDLETYPKRNSQAPPLISRENWPGVALTAWVDSCSFAMSFAFVPVGGLTRAAFSHQKGGGLGSYPETARPRTHENRDSINKFSSLAFMDGH
jgi:hypothetical protein